MNGAENYGGGSSGGGMMKVTTRDHGVERLMNDGDQLSDRTQKHWKMMKKLVMIGMLAFGFCAHATDLKVASLPKGSTITFSGNDLAFEAGAKSIKLEASKYIEHAVDGSDDENYDYRCKMMKREISKESSFLGSGSFNVLVAMHSSSASKTYLALQKLDEPQVKVILQCDDSYYQRGTLNSFASLSDRSITHPITLNELRTVFSENHMRLELRVR